MKTNDHAQSFSGKSVAIVGFGIEGESILRFLEKENVAKVIIYDNATLSEKTTAAFTSLPFSVECKTGNIPRATEADVVFRSPGFRPDLPLFQSARNELKLVTTSTNIFFSRSKTANIIGVTGTKGKGTTSSLIAEMLRQDGKDVYLGGNIGTPPLEFLSQITPASWVVLELSSFQLWDIDYSPHIGVVVMVSVDHLDVHKNKSEYFKAKSQLLRYQKNTDHAVINWDHEHSRIIGQQAVGTVWKTSIHKKTIPGAFIDNDSFCFNDGEKNVCVASLDTLFLKGRHNWQNALSALQASWLAGCSLDSMQKGLASFKGLPHRLEYVRTLDGVSYYDDSFSTVPDPTIAAIESFIEPKVLILGGSSKNSDFSELASEIGKSSSIRGIIGIGEEWKKIKQSLGSVLETVPYDESCAAMSEIIIAARRFAKPGDVVLLSPGCASFGMFRNYKDRGDQFKTVVSSL